MFIIVFKRHFFTLVKWVGSEIGYISSGTNGYPIRNGSEFRFGTIGPWGFNLSTLNESSCKLNNVVFVRRCRICWPDR